MRLHLSVHTGLQALIYSIVLLLLLTKTVTADQIADNSDRPKFCGQALNDALDMLCQQGFFARFKRSAYIAMQMKTIATPTRTTQRRLSSPTFSVESNNFLESLRRTPYIAGQNAMPSLKQKKRKSKRKRRHCRTGIVHDCCQNGCYYSDLMKYCV